MFSAINVHWKWSILTKVLKSFVRPTSKETLAEPQEGRGGMTMRAMIGQVQQLSQNNHFFYQRSSKTTFTKWSPLSLSFHYRSRTIFLFRTQLTILLSIVCIFLLCSIPRSVILMHEVRYQMDRTQFCMPADQARGKFMFVFNVCSPTLPRCGS